MYPAVEASTESPNAPTHLEKSPSVDSQDSELQRAIKLSLEPHGGDGEIGRKLVRFKDLSPSPAHRCLRL